MREASSRIELRHLLQSWEAMGDDSCRHNLPWRRVFCHWFNQLAASNFTMIDASRNWHAHIWGVKLGTTLPGLRQLRKHNEINYTSNSVRRSFHHNDELLDDGARWRCVRQISNPWKTSSGHLLHGHIVSLYDDCFPQTWESLSPLKYWNILSSVVTNGARWQYNHIRRVTYSWSKRSIHRHENRNPILASSWHPNTLCVTHEKEGM